MKLSSSLSNGNTPASCPAIPEKLNCPLKISIMKVGFCLAGQLFNLTKSEKNYCCSFLWMVKRVEKMLLRNKLQPKDYVRLPSFQNSYLYEELLLVSLYE